MAHPSVFPPIDGSLAPFPGFIDFHAEHNGDLPWVIHPSQDSTSTREISYTELSAATHRIAHALRPGRQGPEGEVVGLLLHTDTVLYVALLAGMLRAGLVVRIFDAWSRRIRTIS